MNSEIGYLGGALKRSSVELPTDESPLVASGSFWAWITRDTVCFVQAKGQHCHLQADEELCALISGPVTRLTQPESTAQDIARFVLQRYRSTNTLPVDELDGSFNLILLDGTEEKAILYRNLVGNSFTYYSLTEHGFLFGSNLGNLFDTGLLSGSLDESVLPSFFVNRHLLMRSTFFEGAYRVLPGEQVTATPEKMDRSQRLTFRHLTDDSPSEGTAVERFESVFRGILTQYHRSRPQVANLLSGGVDSSVIQAHWSALPVNQHHECLSFSIGVDHPRSWIDTEYALSASKVLGTRHVLSKVNHPIGDYLIETIGRLAEPPHHVQVAYCAELARVLQEHHVSTGLCGEGADSSFGQAATIPIQNARLLRQLLPSSGLRALGGSVLRFLQRPRWASYFDLANVIPDETLLNHPLNTVARFTDWQSVKSCFGPTLLQEALQERRGLLDQYQVKNDLLDQVHAMALLGSTMSTAALKSALFHSEGVDLVAPYLDSRTLRFILNLPHAERFPWRRPKAILKRSLARSGAADLAYRKKLGFGQPIFEWLGPSGPLASLVDEIDDYPFLPPEVLRENRKQPTWFLYSLLCFDLWYKQFIRRSSPRREAPAYLRLRRAPRHSQTTLV